MKEHRNEKEQRQEGRMTKSDEGDKLSGMKASCGPTESNRIQPYKVFPHLPGEGC